MWKANGKTILELLLLESLFQNKQLLEEFRETRGYWKLKEKWLDHTQWRFFFVKFGPDLRQNTECKKTLWEVHLHHFRTSLKIKFTQTASTQLVPSLGYRMDHREIEVCFPEGTESSLCFAVSRRALGPALLLTRVTVAPSLAVKTSGRESDHPPG